MVYFVPLSRPSTFKPLTQESWVLPRSSETVAGTSGNSAERP
jgi:hypothetical protein